MGGRSGGGGGGGGGGKKGTKKVEANKNLTSGPLCEGNHSKRSWRGTAVSLPEEREKNVL